jgi:hypothetical protein
MCDQLSVLDPTIFRTYETGFMRSSYDTQRELTGTIVLDSSPPSSFNFVNPHCTSFPNTHPSPLVLRLVSVSLVSKFAALARPTHRTPRPWRPRRKVHRKSSSSTHVSMPGKAKTSNLSQESTLLRLPKVPHRTRHQAQDFHQASRSTVLPLLRYTSSPGGSVRASKSALGSNKQTPRRNGYGSFP